MVGGAGTSGNAPNPRSKAFWVKEAPPMRFLLPRLDRVVRDRRERRGAIDLMERRKLFTLIDRLRLLRT